MKGRENLLLIVLSLTGFVTSFGAYVVAANLPSYSKETGAVVDRHRFSHRSL